MNSLPELITKKNLNIIDLISKKSLCIREIAEKLKCAPSTVHKATVLFKKNNLIKEKKEKNKIIILPNNNSVLFKKIKSLLNISSIIKAKSYKSLKKIGSVGVYGSFAKGTDDLNSDVDLWVYTQRSLINIRSIITNLEKDIDRRINVIIINEKKLKKIKKEDPEFYTQLKFTSTKLENEPEFK